MPLQHHEESRRIMKSTDSLNTGYEDAIELTTSESPFWPSLTTGSAVRCRRPQPMTLLVGE